MKKHEGSILFCLTGAFGIVGGMEVFNRRVIKVMLQESSKAADPPPIIIALNDKSAPTEGPAKIYPSSGNKIKFISNFIRHGLRNIYSTKILVVGYVTLVPMTILAKLLRPGIPVIMFVHGMEVWNKEGLRKIRPFEAWMVRTFVDKIISVSQYTADIMSKEYGVPPTKFGLLPNAYDAPDIELSELMAQKTPKRILTVCRLSAREQQKNVDKVIKAVALLAKEMPDITLSIVGDGPLRAVFQELSKELGVEHMVTLHGRLSDEELEQVYREAELFVLPSSKEGFGIVYLEAWAHGMPVICSTIGASHEIVSQGVDGYAVPPEDVPLLAQRIKSILSDDQARNSFALAGYEKAREKYTGEMFSKHLRAILANNS